MDSVNYDNRTRSFLNPVRILNVTGMVENESSLLTGGVPAQPMFTEQKMCTLGTKSSILLDFGKEINGAIQITTHHIFGSKNAKIRVRFGESVSETMAELSEKNAGNNHVARDIELMVCSMGNIEYGETGFRFVRIDILDDIKVEFQIIQAIYIHDSSPMRGSFECDDELLNNIWNTGAYTVHLNMQNYLFDGIKRDRLVWIGDMHPEISTICATYGYHDIVPKSLDFVRDSTPPEKWMNGIATYSMWWIIIHYDWYIRWGNLQYLNEQKEYLKKLCENAVKFVKTDFTVLNDMERFVDWSSKDTKSEIEGVKSIFCIGLDYASRLLNILGEYKISKLCFDCSKQLGNSKCKVEVNKRIAALNILSERNTDYENSILSGNSAKGMSCFMGYYVLLAKAKLDETTDALDIIKKYWGGMLEMGATSFWEDFDIEWMENAFRTDELPVLGKKDIHGDFGRYCYEGFRHSLCHGWASGATAFLTNNILGVKILDAGCKKVKVEPNLCGLEWVRGKYPTQYGEIFIEARKDNNGAVEKIVNCPQEIVFER